MGSSSGWSSDLAGGAEPIVARATPAGRGALAIIRVTGRDLSAVAARVVPELDLSSSWRARLVRVRDAGGEVVDRAVGIAYKAPRSYTGEDMVELVIHGSPFLSEMVVESWIAAGCRPAQAGEFTRRAVANGKLDLVQAEAVDDLVRAETAAQARNARRQLQGELSVQLRSIRRHLVDLMARVAAVVDFGAQGIEVDESELDEAGLRILREIEGLLGTAERGERIRDGVRVVIAGRVNAGKSTLFNALVGRQRAIVSSRPGTTRDYLEAEVDLGGIRVVLVDTAGLGAGCDAVDEEAMRRAVAAVAEAGVVVVVWSFEQAEPPEVEVGEDVAVVRVCTKSDLQEDGEGREGWLAVSARTGAGMVELSEELERVVGGEVGDLGGEVAIARRHREALERAREELLRSAGACPEVRAEGLRWACQALEELTGRVVVDEVLDRVFGSFCIGK